MFLFLKCHPLETGPTNFAASWSRQDIYTSYHAILVTGDSNLQLPN